MKEAVLDAAALRFARAGYEKTTVEDLLADAAISRATFYKHFGGREDVLVELYRARMEGLRAKVLGAVTGSTDVIEMLQRGVGTYFFEVAVAGPLMNELMRHQFANPRLYAIREQVVGEYVAAVRELLARSGQLTVPDFIVDALLTGVDRIAQRVVAGGLGGIDLPALMAQATAATAEYAALVAARFGGGDRER